MAVKADLYLVTYFYPGAYPALDGPWSLPPRTLSNEFIQSLPPVSA